MDEAVADESLIMSNKGDERHIALAAAITGRCLRAHIEPSSNSARIAISSLHRIELISRTHKKVYVVVAKSINNEAWRKQLEETRLLYEKLNRRAIKVPMIKVTLIR
eukprot:3687813-Pleurochrysis_carterae.AAC.2